MPDERTDVGRHLQARGAADDSAGRLRIGDRFYVEPADGSERIPVELVGQGRWGLVHGVMILPVLRLDTDEHANVEIAVGAVVKRVPDA